MTKTFKIVFVDESNFDEEGTLYGYSTLDLYYVKQKTLKMWAKNKGVSNYTSFIDENNNAGIAELERDIDSIAIKKSKIKVKFDLEDSSIVNERKGVLYLYP